MKIQRVIDDQQRLVGVVSRLDILRQNLNKKFLTIGEKPIEVSNGFSVSIDLFAPLVFRRFDGIDSGGSAVNLGKTNRFYLSFTSPLQT